MTASNDRAAPLMRAVDRFWGLGPSTSVRAPGGASGTWERLELEAGPLGLDELADGVAVTLPRPMLIVGEPLLTGRRAGGEQVVLAARDPDGTVALAFDPDAAVEGLTTRAALTRAAPASARLPFHPHRVPPRVRRVVRDGLVALRRRRGAVFPAWPIEPSVEVARHAWLRARQLAEPGTEARPWWPDGKRFVLVLTHDIDSSGGQRVAGELAALEEERGLRSCSYVVGQDWPVDHGRLEALRACGHELGLHDAHHDNRGPFLERGALEARLDGCAELVERHGMTGFRSPSMLRTDALYAALSGRFAYDSSMPDTGLLPEPNGCATVFPIACGGVPVLPLTLPPDGQLRSLGLAPDEVVGRWIAKTEWIARAGGVAMLLTHPEPGFTAEPEMQRAYARFLDWAAARDDAWHALPSEVAARWAEVTAPAGSAGARGPLDP